MTDDPGDRPSERLTPDEQRRFRELMAGFDTSVDVSAVEAEVAKVLSWRLRLLTATAPILRWWWLGPVLVVAGLILAMVLIRTSLLLALPGVVVAALGTWHLARLVRRAVTRLGLRRPADRAGSPGRHSAGDRGSDPT